ncbi:MAG: hypothetical protein IJB71_05000 [Bacilli bacterium]|nr:hypothetical protein [Bacilli bacterium]
MKVKKANIILLTLFMFFFSMSNCLAYYASAFEHDVAIEVTSYEDLTFEFDQEVYGSNMPINITVNNPNPYDITYTFNLPNNITYQVDGANVTNYKENANSAKTNVIVVIVVSGSSLEININVTTPYTESYTETIVLDVEPPIGSITSTNNQASSQTVTINMTDNVGVSAYYFGTNSNLSESDYTEIETTSLAVVNETVSNNGKYYLFVKDISGNIYNTSVDFYKVILEPTGGSGTSYTTSYTGTGNGSTTLYAIWQEKSTLYSVLENVVTSGSGLAISPERNLLGNGNLRTTGLSYWLASPHQFNPVAYAMSRVVGASGNLSYDSVFRNFSVRPSVSLAPGTEYSSGDGSMSNPYVVKMNEINNH